jgi:hypothetical protein
MLFLNADFFSLQLPLPFSVPFTPSLHPFLPPLIPLTHSLSLIASFSLSSPASPSDPRAVPRGPADPRAGRPLQAPR